MSERNSLWRLAFFLLVVIVQIHLSVQQQYKSQYYKEKNSVRCSPGVLCVVSSGMPKQMNAKDWLAVHKPRPHRKVRPKPMSPQFSVSQWLNLDGKQRGRPNREVLHHYYSPSQKQVVYNHHYDPVSAASYHDYKPAVSTIVSHPQHHHQQHHHHQQAVWSDYPIHKQNPDAVAAFESLESKSRYPIVHASSYQQSHDYSSPSKPATSVSVYVADHAAAEGTKFAPNKDFGSIILPKGQVSVFGVHAEGASHGEPSPVKIIKSSSTVTPQEHQLVAPAIEQYQQQHYPYFVAPTVVYPQQLYYPTAAVPLTHVPFGHGGALPLGVAPIYKR